MAGIKSLSDQQLADRRDYLQGKVDDPNTPAQHWWNLRRECDDCNREIERRRQGKEWASNYFGGGRRGNKGGRPKKSGDVPDVDV
jgi:hypothetical protein